MEFEYLGLTDQPPRQSEYRETWDYQRQVHDAVASGERVDTTLFVQHSPVYTAGRRTEPQERPFDGTPVVDVDRGGKITYHGPGQLVGYPIVRLPDGVGVVDYVRRVEEAVIRVLADLGLRTGRVHDRTGVWLPADASRPERKICAIGIRVSRRTTLHGFALNLTPDSLGPFANIIPCGIPDAGVTCIENELGTSPSLADAAALLEPQLADLMSWRGYDHSPDLAD